MDYLIDNIKDTIKEIQTILSNGRCCGHSELSCTFNDEKVLQVLAQKTIFNIVHEAIKKKTVCEKTEFKSPYFSPKWLIDCKVYVLSPKEVQTILTLLENIIWFVKSNKLEGRITQ